MNLLFLSLLYTRENTAITFKLLEYSNERKSWPNLLCMFYINISINRDDWLLTSPTLRNSIIRSSINNEFVDYEKP